MYSKTAVKANLVDKWYWVSLIYLCKMPDRVIWSEYWYFIGVSSHLYIGYWYLTLFWETGRVHIDTLLWHIETVLFFPNFVFYEWWMFLKPNIKIMFGLNFEFLSGNSVTSLTRRNLVKPKWRTSILLYSHNLRFSSRILFRSKDLSAVECKNNA